MWNVWISRGLKLVWLIQRRGAGGKSFSENLSRGAISLRRSQTLRMESAVSWCGIHLLHYAASVGGDFLESFCIHAGDGGRRREGSPDETAHVAAHRTTDCADGLEDVFDERINDIPQSREYSTPAPFNLNCKLWFPAYCTSYRVASFETGWIRNKCEPLLI